MPIYEYECVECSSITDEVFPRTSFPGSIECSTCGADAEKIMSTPARMSLDSDYLAGGYNGYRYHPQMGIWYSSMRDLDRKMKKNGFEPVDSAVATESAERALQRKKREKYLNSPEREKEKAIAEEGLRKLRAKGKLPDPDPDPMKGRLNTKNGVVGRSDRD